MKLNTLKRNIMSWNTMNQNIRMINYRELYFRISNFRISTFRKSNYKKTGFVQRTLFLFFSISCTLLFSFGCKPQRIISEGVVSENMVSESIVSQTDNSSVLQLKDSLRIMETQIAILESDLKRAREENFNLRSETLMYEVNYDTNTTVDSITKRPAVIREVYTVSKKLYEESVREYEMLLQEASIENRSLLTRNSDLKLINESLDKKNFELISERNSKSERSSKSGFKHIIIIVVVILIIVIKYVRKN